MGTCYLRIAHSTAHSKQLLDLRAFSRITGMRRLCSIILCTAIGVASFQAYFSHVHRNRASDHVRESHMGQGLTLHTHMDAPANVGAHRAMQPSPSQETSDALFLPWTPAASPINILLAALPVESWSLNPPIQVAYYRTLPVRHAHDPPLVSSSAPRSPPA